MEHLKRAQQAHDNEIRVEGVVDMACEAAIINSTMCLSEAVGEDLLEELPCVRHASIDPLITYLTSRGEEDDDIVMQLDNLPRERPELLGVCLKVATPVREKRGDRVTFSWGHCALQWVFGLTYEEAWNEAVKWVESLEPREVS